MSFTKLPQELIDQVIDHLHDDKAALQCCALVSRSWLHRIRTHIWSVVMYTRYKPDMKALASFLASTPHIPPYIAHLGVHQKDNLSYIPSFSPLLHNMTTLMLDRIDPFPSASAFAIQSSSLQTLQLSAVVFGTFIDLVRFISSFPNLSGLLLIAVTITESSYEVEELQSLPLIRNIRRLRLDSRHAMELAPIFASSPCGAYLETLEVRLRSSQCETSFRTLLSVAKNSLNSLAIEVHHFHRLPNFSSWNLRIIPLSSITNLRSLGFREIIADDKSQITWLLKSLSEVRGAYHGMIIVNFRFINPAAVSDVRDELHLVDELLADLKRNAGADIKITIPFEVWDVTGVKSLFPQARKMHLLKPMWSSTW